MPPKVISARFVASSTSIGSAISETSSEIVFVGRSNVGKSSLLNALTQKKGLAKTSSTPGKTRLINFFAIEIASGGENIKLTLVDLPGFGYAKVSKDEQAEWQRTLSEFLKKRRAIRVFVRLIDSRHPELPQDKMAKEFIDSLIRADQRDIAVFTKIDKLNRKEKDALKRKYPETIALSSSSQDGIDQLLSKLVELTHHKEERDGAN